MQQDFIIQKVPNRIVGFNNNVLFYYYLGPRELQQLKDLRSIQNQLAIELGTDLRQINPFEKTWNNTIRKYFAKHENYILEAVSTGFGEGGGGSIWTYPGSILFAVSLLTTLGTFKWNLVFY